MSKTAQGGADAKKAPTTQEKKVNAQLTIKETQKTAAEILEEQKQFFAKKNDVLRKLDIFEKKEEQLKNALIRISEEEQDNPQTMFEDDSNFKLTVMQGYNNDLFTIKKTIVIKSVISTVLAEIEKSRKNLENEFLS